jgi:flagellar basal body rod protein FlgC
MDVLSVALDNIGRATARLDGVAARIAKVAEPQDTIDLSAEMVALMEARNSFEAGIAVLRTANELSKNLVDLLV